MVNFYIKDYSSTYISKNELIEESNIIEDLKFKQTEKILLISKLEGYYDIQLDSIFDIHTVNDLVNVINQKLYKNELMKINEEITSLI